MTTTRTRRLSVAVVAAMFIAVSLLTPRLPGASRVGAQTTGTAKQVAVSLSNRTGNNTHLWIGHQPPASQKAYVLPQSVALWYVDFNAGGRNANNVVYIDDKLTVNAMKVGDVSPFPSLVTKTLTIRGFAQNIRVIWNGADFELLVDYEDDGGKKLAGGDGQASPSGPGVAGTTSGTSANAGEGTQDPDGLDSEELTAAVNAAIIAVITGILIGGLALGGAEAATAGAEGASAAPAGGPLDSGLRDPDTGDSVSAWEPGKYGPGEDGKEGKAGDVWYDGRWQSSSEAAAQIGATLSRKQEQEVRNQDQLNDFRTRNQALDREAAARQQAADSAARANRDAMAARLKQAQDEARKNVRDAITASMNRNAEVAKHFRDSANTLDKVVTAGEVIEKTADAGVDILGDHTGPIGKGINIGYTLTKSIASKMAEGQSFEKAGQEGLADVFVDQVKGAVIGKLGFKTPNLAAASFEKSTFIKTITKDGLRTSKVRSWVGHAAANWALGERLKMPLNSGMQSLGLKQPDA